MSTSDRFFQRRQAAAVLKHGIIKRYMPVFATMASTHSPGQRVVYLDGYAGRGGYEDGAPGSPLLALETAKVVAGWNRRVESVFVEADHDNYLRLEARLREAAKDGPPWLVRHGDVIDYLDETLALARGVPLFAFLDPFGAALPFDALVDRLLGRPEGRQTEVLLNLNVNLVQRWGGLLARDTRNAGQEAMLARLDRFFGGVWWRDVYRGARGGESPATASAAAAAVVHEFRAKVRLRTGHSAFCVPVRRRPGHLPLFLLVLFYRHPVAPWKFNEAVSLANADWREACRSEKLAEEEQRHRRQPPLDGLFSPEEMAADIEDRLEQEWRDEISKNLRRIASEARPSPLRHRISDVYGQALGQARDKHVRQVWKTLAREHVIKPRTQREIYDETIAGLRWSG